MTTPNLLACGLMLRDAGQKAPPPQPGSNSFECGFISQLIIARRESVTRNAQPRAV